MADIEERMRKLVNSVQDEQDINGADTFAERAEWYYQKKPELLELLQDLYHGYTTLLERCCHGKRQSRQVSTVSSILLEHGCSSTTSSRQEDGYSDVSDHGGIDYWDAESTISYQQQQQQQHITNPTVKLDKMVTKLVITNVEKDLLAQQVTDMEKQLSESLRRTDLLKKLIEVLDSERAVLLKENVKLSYKVTALLEENQEQSSRAMFFKQKADDLARFVLKIREDHSVCMLTRKIEDLQEQINQLEKTNKDQRGYEGKGSRSGKERSKNEGKQVVAMVGCFQFEKLRLKKNDSKKNSVLKWWQRVKRLNMFICGHYYYTCYS